jgi:hypothetical protein
LGIEGEQGVPAAEIDLARVGARSCHSSSRRVAACMRRRLFRGPRPRGKRRLLSL